MKMFISQVFELFAVQLQKKAIVYRPFSGHDMLVFLFDDK
jgi:hypothetical protein